MIKIMNNLHLKLLALLSAIVLWFIVITVENTVYPFPEPVDVEIMNLGSNLSLANNVPPVKLYLRVDKEELKTLTANDFDIFIDLKNAEAGTQSIAIQAATDNPDVKILQVDPSEMELKLSPTSEREVEVAVNIEGEPSSGYAVEEVTTETEVVKITGAQSIIDRIDHVNAELLLDGTETTDVNQSVMLIFESEYNVPQGLVQVVPEQIVVRATISSELKQKEVEVIAGFANEDERIAWEGNISVSPETVLVAGSEEALAEISSLQTNPFEISTLNRAGSVEASLSLPEGVSLVSPGQKVVISLLEEVAEEPIAAPPSPEESPEVPSEPTI